MSVSREAIRTLRPILVQALRRWYIVAASMLLCAALVIAFCNYRGQQYTTVMVITPTASGGNGLSSAMNALGSASSLLGLVGGNQPPQFDHFIMLLQSDSVSETLIKNPHIMSLIFGTAIDPVTGKWRNTLSHRVKNFIFSLFGVHRADKPTVDDVQFALNSMLIVEEDQINKTVAKVRCTSSDTHMCHDVMLAAAQAAQARLDKIAFDSAQRMISYLNGMLSSANGVSLRQALTNVMASTQVQAALASIGQDRTVILDGPSIPTTPSFPKPTFLLEVALFVGFLIGVALTWLLRETMLTDLFSARFREFGSQRET